MQIARRRGALPRRRVRSGRGGATDDARRSLPTRRAVLGAVLITASVAGVLSAHRAASAPPGERWVVTTSAFPAGHRLRQEDLGTIAIDLPRGVAAMPERQALELVGRVTRAPLAELNLVSAADLHEPGRFPTAGSVEVAVELDAARGLRGTLVGGDVVDVLATDPDGTGTRPVARGAIVSRVADDDRAGIGASGTVVVRLNLADADTATAVVDAAVRSELSLVLPAPSPEQDR